VLPLIDLMILVAWTSMIWAVFHKALWLALATKFTVLGLVPYDFVLLAGVALLFALALAARVWVKAHEPALLRKAERRQDVLDEYGLPGEPVSERAGAPAVRDRAPAA
jgi:hypothetical protein